jgi:hypothetical protein
MTPIPERPRAGGSYVLDPRTGKLSRRIDAAPAVPAPEPEPEPKPKPEQKEPGK